MLMHTCAVKGKGLLVSTTPSCRKIRVQGFLILAFATFTMQAADLDQTRKLFSTGKYAECIETASEGIKNRSWSEKWHHLKIRAELATGRYPEALKSVEKALADFSTSIKLHLLGHEVYLMNNDPGKAEALLVPADILARRANSRYLSLADMVTLGRYFLFRGFDARQVLEALYDAVKKKDPEFVDAYLATGELALLKHDYRLAGKSYKKAAALNPEDPDVHFGLARSYAQDDPQAAGAALEKALHINPNHVASLLLSVDMLINAELYPKAETLINRVLAVNPRCPEAFAYRAVMAHLNGDFEQEKKWRKDALAFHKTNPAVDHLIGRKLSQNYRFKEAADYQKRALAFDPDFLPAKLHRSQDLLRLGSDEEGWALADQVFENDRYNVVAHNLVVLNKTMQTFKTLRGDGFQVRMAPGEAGVYGRDVLALLADARKTLSEKYDIRLQAPIVVEIFPEQKDFAIRTFGLPGGEGFLGVCFGNVITMNSPASQGPAPANWKAVLYHEFCHVITLAKTRNRMPRWLSEGISVYEEKQKNPAWGQSMTPLYREMILGGQLTPVSELSSAFLNPPSLLHLNFAYYESALVIEYLVKNHGLKTVKAILADLGEGIAISDALKKHVKASDALDAAFREYAQEKAKKFAPAVDWEAPDISVASNESDLKEWISRNPDNFEALQRLAARYIQGEKWAEAKKTLKKLIGLYPGDTRPGNAHLLLAGVHQKLGETHAERAVLDRLAAIDSDAMAAYLRVIALDEQTKNWKGMAENAERALCVNPLLPSVHRHLATAAERINAPERAIPAYRALLRMDPIDPAMLNHNLAKLLLSEGELKQAKRHALMALEAAPRFRHAHATLLEIVGRLKPEKQDKPEASKQPEASTKQESPRKQEEQEEQEEKKNGKEKEA